MPAYQPLIPTGLVDLDVDYQNIQDNFNQANIVYGTDHSAFDNATPNLGFHKAIHLVPQGPPAAIAGIGEVYVQQRADGYSTGAQIWYQFIDSTPVTINYPITLNIKPLVASPGYTFLPGGILMQWGLNNLVSTNTVITFPKPFAFAVYNIQMTVVGVGSAGVSAAIGAITNANFKAQMSQTATVYWMAIGS